MALSRTVAITVPSTLLSLLVAGLTLQGCSTAPVKQAWQSASASKAERGEADRNTTDSYKQALAIKPTTETAGFYDAIKGADRVAFVILPFANSAREESIAVSFTAQEPEFWDITQAVVSARKGGDP